MTNEKQSGNKVFGLGVAGGVASGLLASACCIGPLLAVFLGITGAGALAQMAPYRPYFGALMLGFLVLGFYLTYRKPKTEDGVCGPCCAPAKRRTRKIALWIATVAAVVLFFAPNLLIFAVG